MPALETSDSIDTMWTFDQARQRILDYFTSVKAKVTEGESGEIVATRGSRVLIRILGAY